MKYSSIGQDASGLTANQLAGFFSSEAVSKHLICNGALSATVGVALGICVSLVVNCTLAEISLSNFFATYFGILFTVVGLVVLWRVHSGANLPHATDTTGRKLQLTFFSSLIVLSGIMCFALEKNWFIGLSPIAKIPLYTLLGISVAFALIFSMVDVINYAIGFFQPHAAKSIVESKSQVYLVVFAAMLIGGIFGTIFGVLDLEDEVRYHIRLALLREEHYCCPIGGLIGGLAGFGNEYIRQTENKFQMKRDLNNEI